MGELRGLSIVVPVLNEGERLARCVGRLQRLRRQGAEVVLVDGGSSTDELEPIRDGVDQLWITEAGRGQQLRLGAERASGEWLLFLHVDTQLPEALGDWFASLRSPGWGFFPLKLSGSDWRLRVIEWMINRRSALTRVATGDQCQYLHQTLLARIGGFPAQALMEDVEVSKRLRAIDRPQIATQRVITSSRRWEQRGVIRTVWLMWCLRFAYWLGVSPQRLRRIYYG